jgi:AcrR family transcriptional regulator
MQDLPLSLRERNRIDTWTAVHETASSLALEEGLSSATIEAIAARAGISKRTFFNYFPTKEDAVLGTRAPTLPDELLERFRTSGDDLLTRTVRLLTGVLGTSFHGGAGYERRRAVVRAHPELRARIMQHIDASEQLVDSVLNDRLGAADAAAAVEQLPDAVDSPRALLMLAGTITRFAYSRNPEATAVDVGGNIEESVNIFREVVKATL